MGTDSARDISNEDYKLLVDSITDYAIFILTVDGRVASWNRGAQHIFGYEAREILNEHFSKLYLPTDIDADEPDRALRDALAFGRVENEGWRLRRDGKQFWANVVITPLRNDRNELRGFAQVTRDLSERRTAEEALRQAEQRFHGLVDAVTDYAVFMLDAEGNVATWNAGARKAKGYEEREIVGQHFSRFYTEEDRQSGRPARLLEQVRREGRIEDEGWRVRKDGTRFWANVIITKLLDEHGNIAGFAKVTRDLTNRRDAQEMERKLIIEKAAREAAENVAIQAEEANRIKDEFLATVSHELRTPLNAIVGWSKMLLQRELDPMLVRGLEVIDRNADAQVKLIEDILDVSRIITGKLRLETKSTDLVAITRDAVDVIRPSALAKSIDVQLSFDQDPCILVGDPERLRQVAWNLLSNAVKFTANGGKVRAHVGQDGSRVFLRVEDSGRGIAPKFLPHVFDRFKQEEGSVSRRVGGLGLGLALVRHIVELHGGVATVESQQGKGSTFTVTLPVRAISSVPQETPATSLRGEVAPAVERSLPPLPLQGVRVLVVDDDEDARVLVAAVLESAGAEVATAASVAEALKRLVEVRPLLIVSDIGMPVEDGYQLMQRIRALPVDAGGAIPAIALTAYTRLEDQRKALAAGFMTHVAKPVAPDVLVRAVANLLTLSVRGQSERVRFKTR